MTETNVLSFLPDDYLPKKSRRRTLALGGGILAFAAVSLGGTFLFSQGFLRATERQCATVSRAYDNALRELEQINALHQRQQIVLRRARTDVSIIENMPGSNLLAELTNALPGETSLQCVALDTIARPEPMPVLTTAFDMKKAALEARRNNESNIPAPLARSDVTLTVSGIAGTEDRLAEFLDRLRQSPQLKEVKLLSSEVGKGGHGESSPRRFEIRMTLDSTFASNSSPEGRQTAAAQ